MTIDFYMNNSDPDKINKSLTPVDIMTGFLKESCDIVKPSITVSHSGVINANYCYIPEFGRYYFISNQKILTAGTVRIDLSVDPLYTYKNQILSIPCIIDNSTSDNNAHLTSDIFKATVKSATDVLTFPSGFNESGEFILITAGG